MPFLILHLIPLIHFIHLIILLSLPIIIFIPRIVFPIIHFHEYIIQLIIQSFRTFIHNRLQIYHILIIYQLYIYYKLHNSKISPCLNQFELVTLMFQITVVFYIQHSYFQLYQLGTNFLFMVQAPHFNHIYSSSRYQYTISFIKYYISI